MQEKKQENIVEKAAESGKKGEDVPLREKPENEPIPKQTNAAEVVASVEKDSIKIGYAILQQQMDELKKEIDDLRKKVNTLEK